jgi:hypothetical protein
MWGFFRGTTIARAMDETRSAAEARLPAFYEQLKPEDQDSYCTLRAAVGRPERRYNRFRRLATLRESFDEIRQFCLRGDDRDFMRCLVCGICWLDRDDIGVNTRQLRLLIAKSKSSINGAFAKMNYMTRPAKICEFERLCRAIPPLKGFPAELRQWTIRSPLPHSPPPPAGDATEDASENGWDLEAVFERECPSLMSHQADLDAFARSPGHTDPPDWRNIDTLLDVTL